MDDSDFTALAAQHPDHFRRDGAGRPMVKQPNNVWFVCHSSFLTPEFLQVVGACHSGMTPTQHRHEALT